MLRPMNEPTLAVTAAADDADSRRAAQQLAAELHLPYVEPDGAASVPMVLIRMRERLELRDHRAPGNTAVCVDFSEHEIKRYRATSRRDPLIRAIGKALAVVDATAGLGADALRLACLGFHITAIERAPVAAALLCDGLARARASGKLAREHLDVIVADARVTLPAMHPRPEVVYIDPMFPPKRKKSAAVRKEIRVLRALAGDDDDALALLEVARACASRRVVVKRPDDAPPLAPHPTMSYAGKLVRYDVYVTLRGPKAPTA